MYERPKRPGFATLKLCEYRIVMQEETAPHILTAMVWYIADSWLCDEGTPSGIKQQNKFW